MKIYMGDLTHDTITISNEAFPLNVGYIASYLMKDYSADLELFKYSHDLVNKLEQNPPNILALSNYPWNCNLSLSLFRYAKSINRNILTVMGGPNMSNSSIEQRKFIYKNKDILDYYVMFEGEQPFKDLYENFLDCELNINKIKQRYIPGVIQYSRSGFKDYVKLERRKNLDEIPSPYINGLFDKFFDNKLTPMIETHRGCPYQCTFCHEGNKYYTKINKYSDQRVIDELVYIAKKIGSRVGDLIIADPNFGLFQSHVELGPLMNELNQKYGYPKTIIASSAKNSQKNLLNLSANLGKVNYPIWMSVQSMNENVLKNIKRKNISSDHMLEIQNQFRRNKTPTKSEVIMSLPGESLDTHVESIEKLILLKLDLISTYQLMLVNGSEMKENANENNEYGFVSKYRLLPRNFTKIKNKNVIETEEIVISTKDCNFNDYIDGRILHLMISIFYNGKSFRGLFKFAIEEQFDIKKLLKDLIICSNKNKNIKKFIIDSFIAETKSELFDSISNLHKFFSKKKNFQKLVSGEIGGNLLQKYTSIAYKDAIISLCDVLKEVLLLQVNDKKQEKIVLDISKHYKLSYKNYLSEDRLKKVDKGIFEYNIPLWLDSEEKASNFSLEKKKFIAYYTEKEQYNKLNNYIERYGNTYQSFGKILTRMWIFEMARLSKGQTHV